MAVETPAKIELDRQRYPSGDDPPHRGQPEPQDSRPQDDGDERQQSSSSLFWMAVTARPISHGISTVMPIAAQAKISEPHSARRWGRRKPSSLRKVTIPLTIQSEVLALLACPHCGGDLRQNGASLICSNGHTANIARQGYVSLLGRHGGTHTADSAAMIAARERILGAGLFEPVAGAVVAAATTAGLDGVEGAVADFGSGPGYYFERVLEATPSRFGVAIDNSKYAARRAARRHPRGGAVVADIWDELPLRADSVAVAINVFAPRNGEEISRVLAPGGRLVVVTPASGHLNELVEPFSMISVDSDKESRLAASLAPVGERLEERPVEWQMKLSRAETGDLVAMGPNAGRLEQAELEDALDSLSYPTAVTGSVRVTVTEAGP